MDMDLLNCFHKQKCVCRIHRTFGSKVVHFYVLFLKFTKGYILGSRKRSESIYFCLEAFIESYSDERQLVRFTSKFSCVSMIAVLKNL
jgi:hypothetical protein